MEGRWPGLVCVIGQRRATLAGKTHDTCMEPPGSSGDTVLKLQERSGLEGEGSRVLITEATGGLRPLGGESTASAREKPESVMSQKPRHSFEGTEYQQRLKSPGPVLTWCGRARLNLNPTTGTGGPSCEEKSDE